MIEGGYRRKCEQWSAFKLFPNFTRSDEDVLGAEVQRARRCSKNGENYVSDKIRECSGRHGEIFCSLLEVRMCAQCFAQYRTDCRPLTKTAPAGCWAAACSPERRVNLGDATMKKMVHRCDTSRLIVNPTKDGSLYVWLPLPAASHPIHTNTHRSNYGVIPIRQSSSGPFVVI